MQLVVTTDFRFAQTPDGKVWSRTSYSRPFWDRYLSVFEKVRIIARAEQVKQVDSRYKAVIGPGVEFAPVPYYLGPFQYVKIRQKVKHAVRSAVGIQDAVLCRVGSRLADDLIPALWSQRRPYALEVVGDPMEALAAGAVKHPLRPLFRELATRALLKQCARASAVSYVTQHTLQRRYPAGLNRLSVSVSDAELNPGSFSPAPRVFTTYYSSTELGPEAYAKTPKLHAGPVPPRIVFVGSLAQMYKGPDVLLRAARRLINEGLALELSIVGEGRHLEELKQMARDLGVARNVVFHGELPAGAAVREQMDWASLFVLPSRTEGLPRVMVEAMARALPCVGSNVGGIPELLHCDDLVPPGDPEALAARIRQVLHSPERLNSMSERNLKKAQEFRPELLEKRRTEFYRFLKEITRDWVEARELMTA